MRLRELRPRNFAAESFSGNANPLHLCPVISVGRWHPNPQTITRMFKDLLGDAQKQQEEMKRQLAAITVEAVAGDGAVKVTANGNRQILDISIRKEKLDWEDVEQVQDLILAAVNGALELAAGTEQAESKKLIQHMLPPGLGGLFG